MDADGNVGINNSDPQAQLDVNGNVNVTGDIVVSGNVAGTNLFKEIYVIENTFPVRGQAKYITLPDNFNEANLIILSLMVKAVGGNWYMINLEYGSTYYIEAVYNPDSNWIRLFNRWSDDNWNNQPVRIVIARF